MEGLVEGRVVHFVLDNKVFTEKVSGKDQTIEGLVCRPAIIVNAWGGKPEDGMVNLQVFLDGDNDNCYIENLKFRPLVLANKNDSMFGIVFQIWMTSVKYSESKEVGTWHWPERN